MHDNKNIKWLLARLISTNALLLTNSFSGSERDINSIKSDESTVFLIGLNPALTNSIVLERQAKKGDSEILTVLPIDTLSDNLSDLGVKNEINDCPSNYLCNSAYYKLLEKFNGNALLIHVPNKKHLDPETLNKFVAFIKKI